MCEVDREVPIGAWPLPQLGLQEIGLSGNELAGLTYVPPPPPESTDLLEAMLGTQLPQKPKSWATGAYNCGLQAGLSSSSRASAGPTCARPGEPVNKVYVLLSNDLEGFLPYALVISEEAGLEFSSLTANPDFMLPPHRITRITRLSQAELHRDAFFASLSRSVLQRPELWPGRQVRGLHVDSTCMPPTLEERVRPPYTHIVQLNVRRESAEGGQVLVFIATQSDGLAAELVRSCNQLRRRRGVSSFARHNGDVGIEPERPGSPGVPSRGCPSPRTVVAASRSSALALPDGLGIRKVAVHGGAVGLAAPGDAPARSCVGGPICGDEAIAAMDER